MTAIFQKPETTIQVKRTFAAPREKVFEAWTKPEFIKKWMGGMHITRPVAQVDLWEGGTYRIKLQPPGGNAFFVVGTYREVVIPERLVYTWRFEGGLTETGETLVTVEFLDLGSTTQVILNHERFPSVQVRDIHWEGWDSCIAALDDVLKAPHDT